MFGHLKGQRNTNEMQNLNVQAAVVSRIYSEMQESENHRDMQDSYLLLTLNKIWLLKILTLKKQARLKK